MPGFRELLRHGRDRLGQRPADPGAAEHRRRLVHARHRRVAGRPRLDQQHVPRQRPAVRATARRRSTPRVLQAETLAQAAERGGKKVAQIEWAGGRSGAIQGPTLDFRNFRSGRGVATNYIAPADIAGVHRRVRPAVRPSRRLRRPARSRRRRRRRPPAGPTCRSRFSPAQGDAPARRSTPGIDKYGLNAYIYDSHERRQDALRPGPVLAHQGRRRRRRRPRRRASGPTSRSRSSTAPPTLDGKTGAMLVKVERLASDLSQVRLFHTSVTRAIATLAELARRAGLHRQLRGLRRRALPVLAGRRLRRARGRHRQRGDLRRAGPVLGDRLPPADQVRARHLQARPGDGRLPGHRRVPAPVPRARHPEAARTAPTTRPTTTSRSTARRDGRVKQREAFIRRAYKGADATMRLAQERLRDRDLTTFVSSDHGFAPQFAAIDASKVLVDLGLLSTAADVATAARRPVRRSARRRPAGPAARCRSTSTSPGATRRAAGSSRSPAAEEASDRRRDQGRVPRPRRPQRLDRRRPARGLGRDRPRVHQGRGALHPERRQAARPTWPIRRAPATSSCSRTPPYQFDAATPGTLIARSAFFGQHGYVPDVQDLDSNTNMRATFLAGGDGDRPRRRPTTCAASTSRPTAAFLLDIPVPQQSQGDRAARHARATATDYKPLSIIGLNDFHGQLDQTTTPIDGLHRRPSAARRSSRRCSTRRRDRLPGRTLLLAAGDNVGASPPNSALLEDRPAIDVENAWGLDATSFGNHEFDFGVERILAHQERADFPFLSANIVEEATGRRPDWLKPSTVFSVNGVRVGVIGATVKTTPELVPRRRHRGPVVPRRGRADPQGVERLAPARRQGADRRHPRGRGARRQRDRRPAGGAVGGPDHRDRRGAPGHDDRPRDRRSHAPHRQHGRRPHPGGRGRQRRRQLLRRAADGQGRRRRVGRPRRRASPRTSASRRGPTCRRSSTRPTPRRRRCATR